LTHVTTGPPLATDTVVDARLVDIEVDPYPLYAWMRREQPIAWVPETGRLWLTTWDLCAEAGAADEIFGPTSDVHELVYGLPNVMAMSGEEHRRARAPLDARFRPRAVNEYVETLVRPAAVRYIERVQARGRADLTGEVLEKISSRAVGDVLGLTGVPDETLLRWFRGLAAYLDDLGRGDPAIGAHAAVVKTELREYLAGRIDELRAHPDGSTLDHMVHHGLADGQVRAVGDIAGTVGTMIVGGFQEPAHAAANAILGLLARPEQAAAVAADPRGLAAATVHEGLRWIPPFNMTEKRTAADVVIAGKRIPAGTEIALVIGSANRDENHFDHPDTFDLHRRRANNLAFGFGAHFCVGHYVARQVAQVSVEELFTRLPGLRLDPEHEPVVHGWMVRAAKTLPVVWDA
jgi:aromatic O-demethylase, cytochrome P450 subunit